MSAVQWMRWVDLSSAAQTAVERERMRVVRVVPSSALRTWNKLREPHLLPFRKVVSL